MIATAAIYAHSQITTAKCSDFGDVVPVEFSYDGITATTSLPFAVVPAPGDEVETNSGTREVVRRTWDFRGTCVVSVVVELG